MCCTPWQSRKCGGWLGVWTLCALVCTQQAPADFEADTKGRIHRDSSLDLPEYTLMNPSPLFEELAKVKPQSQNNRMVAVRQVSWRSINDYEIGVLVAYSEESANENARDCAPFCTEAETWEFDVAVSSFLVGPPPLTNVGSLILSAPSDGRACLYFVKDVSWFELKRVAWIDILIGPVREIDGTLLEEARWFIHYQGKTLPLPLQYRRWPGSSEFLHFRNHQLNATFEAGGPVSGFFLGAVTESCPWIRPYKVKIFFGASSTEPARLMEVPEEREADIPEVQAVYVSASSSTAPTTSTVPDSIPPFVDTRGSIMQEPDAIESPPRERWRRPDFKKKGETTDNSTTTTTTTTTGGAAFRTIQTFVLTVAMSYFST